MSIAKTYNLVATFVQSESCRLTCKDTEDVHYYFSGKEQDGNFHVQGLPMRSCGCKAQRVLNRLNPTLSQFKTLGPYCVTWDCLFVAVPRYQLPRGNWSYHYLIVCHNCIDTLAENYPNLFVESFIGHENEEDMEKWYAEDGTEYYDWPGETGPFYRQQQMAYRIERHTGARPEMEGINSTDNCSQCNGSQFKKVLKKHCFSCKFENRVEQDPGIQENEAQIQLQADEELNVTIDEEVLRPTTPTPTFQVFNDFNGNVYVPNEVVDTFAEPIAQHNFEDNSDDEHFDLQQYMYSHGYY
jgi:hypothetical protein